MLLIDEISMISGELFDTLDYIAKYIKRNKKPFGGIQIVCSGDFFQLPPIPPAGSHFSICILNIRKGKVIHYCFESQAWKDAIEYTIELKTIFRQVFHVHSKLKQGREMKSLLGY